jgi:hypothetical protein
MRGGNPNPNSSTSILNRRAIKKCPSSCRKARIPREMTNSTIVNAKLLIELIKCFLPD